VAPPRWDEVRRVLAVRLDNVGDVVLLGPALRALRRRLPGAAIALLASPAGSQAAPLLPWVDEVLVERVLWQDVSGALPPDPAREAALADRLRAGAFDAAVIFTSFSQSPYPPAFVAYGAGIPIRVGASKEFGGGVLTLWVRSPPDGLHQADRNLHLLETAGIEPGARDLELVPPPAARARAADLLAEAGIGEGEPFLALVPGASCPARRYDALRFRDAARRLAAAAPLPVVILGSPGETGLADTIRAADRRIASLAGRTTVPEFAAAIERAALVITNNSAALHIADAFRRPQVVLYSGTEMMSQWRPRASPARLLRRGVSCSPCHGFTCPFRMECLDVPADEVAREALEMLHPSNRCSP
jgi:ADP-heptose:LPS heptosyltransferase